MKTEITEKEAKNLIEARNWVPWKIFFKVVWKHSLASRVLFCLGLLCLVIFGISTGIFLVEIDEDAPTIYVLPDNQIISAMHGPTNIYYSDGLNTGMIISKVKEDFLSIVERKINDTQLIISLAIMIVCFVPGMIFLKKLLSIDLTPEIPPYEERIKYDLEQWKNTGELPAKFEERYSIYLFKSK